MNLVEPALKSIIMLEAVLGAICRACNVTGRRLAAFSGLFCSWAVLLFLLVPQRAAAEVDAGFFYDRFALILSPGHRTEIAGPLFYTEERDGQTTWAVPPLTARVEDPLTDFVEHDFLYPVLTYDRFGSEYRWQLFQLLSVAGGQNQQEQSSRRFTLFPIYFQQRSEDPDRNYTALVPIYGRLKDRLMRDETYFVLFPLYSKTRKRDVVTDNYLYPFFHVRRGDALWGWQFWPFIGREHKDVTYATNGFGDVQIVGGHDALTVMWPFFIRHHGGIGTENPVRQWAVLPLYSSVRSPMRDSSTVLWPFFSKIEDRQRKYVEWQTPWPLIVFARGEGKHTSRVWPFFSRAESTNLQSRFYLWPVYKYNRVHTESLDRERTRILFFLYSDTIQKNLETGSARRRVDFWPLFTHQRDYNGNTRLQVLSVLEPLLPNNKSIERNYSPLWSFWRSEFNPQRHARSQSLLWNLYRREQSPESKKVSLLFGLFQYQSGPDGHRLRVFHIPFGKARRAAEANAASAETLPEAGQR